MSPVICPSCGEKGNLSDQFLGKKIRCQKCGNSFLAVPTLAASPVAHAASPVAHAASPVAHAASPIARAASPVAHAVSEAPKPTDYTIEVDGLDASSWTATAATDSAVETHVQPREHHEPTTSSTASPREPEHADGTVRQYKVLTSKDRFFEGKYEFARLEEALNFYARQGWAVRAMATPHVTGFSGGPREELVVLLER